MRRRAAPPGANRIRISQLQFPHVGPPGRHRCPKRSGTGPGHRRPNGEPKRRRPAGLDADRARSYAGYASTGLGVNGAAMLRAPASSSASSACDLWCRYRLVVSTPAWPIQPCTWTIDARLIAERPERVPPGVKAVRVLEDALRVGADQLQHGGALARVQRPEA